MVDCRNRTVIIFIMVILSIYDARFKERTKLWKLEIIIRCAGTIAELIALGSAKQEGDMSQAFNYALYVAESDPEEAGCFLEWLNVGCKAKNQHAGDRLLPG